MNRTFGAALLLALAACSRPADLVREPDPAPEIVVIENVAVLDVELGERVPGLDVVVRDGRIASIRNAGSEPPAEGATRVDGTNGTLLPGLVDAHGHVGNSPAPPWADEMPDPERNLRAFLYAGVTTVFDPCDLSSHAFARRDAVAKGDLLGPRIYAAGPMITAEGGHPVPIVRQLAPWWLRWYLLPRLAIEVETPEGAREAVASLAEWRADFVKVAVDRIPRDAPRLGRELLDAIVGAAKKSGLRVAAHIGTTDDAIDAADAGASIWLHGVYKERIPDERIEELAAFRIPMVPTTVVFESWANLLRGKREPTRLERETAPPAMLAGFDEAPASYDPAPFAAYLEELRSHRADWRENVGRLHRAGVTILAGSDAQSGVFPGAGLHRELALLVESGLSPAEAIRAATIAPARFLAGADEPEFGRVAPGKIADLLLVEGDPTVDLAALAEIRAVILGGVPLVRTPVAR